MREHGDTSATLAAVFSIRAQSVDSWIRTGRIGKDKLVVLARRYNRPVAWFLGQEQDEEDMLTDDERKLLADYRALHEPLKAVAAQQVDALRQAQSAPPPPLAPPAKPRQ